MTPNNNYSKLLVGILLTGSMAFTACMDSNYDVSDLDKNVAFGSDEGLKLPSKNSTKEIELSDLLDIDDSDVISTDENGNYVFAKGAGEADVTPARPEIDRINVAQSTPPANYDLAIDELNENLSVPASVPDAAIDAAINTIWEERIPASITSKGRITLFNYHTDLPIEVVDLQELQADNTGGKSAIAVRLSFSPDLAAVANKISEMKVFLPSFFDFDVSTTNTNVGVAKDANNVVTLSNVPTSGVDLKLTIKALNEFNQTSLTDKSHLVIKEKTPTVMEKGKNKKELLLQGEIDLNMTIKKASDLNKTALVNKLKSRTNGEYTIITRTTIGNIAIDGAIGKFDPSIDLTDGIGEVKINNLPDFLTGDEVKLVVDNPQIGLSIASNINVVGQLENLKLVAKRKDGSTETITLPTITLKRHEGDINSSTTTKILILDKDKQAQPDESHKDFKDAKIVNPTEGSLASLIYNIPESITFECDASADETQLATIKLGQQYKIQPTYEFWAPLAFNHGSVIVYNDTIDGWNEDLKDLKMVKGSYVELTADVTNRVPVDLTLSAIPMQIGSNGKLTKMDEALFKVEVSTPNNGKGNIIEAGSVDKPKTTKILIKIISQTEEALSLLDGISYHATAATPADGEYQGKALNKSTQKLKIENIAPVLKGRVIVNLDK